MGRERERDEGKVRKERWKIRGQRRERRISESLGTLSQWTHC